MAVVTVRAFGALRELVGASTQVDAEHVAALVALLTERHGDEFSRRLERSTIAVDDEPVDATDTSPLGDGTEVVLLPPFAGG